MWVALAVLRRARGIRGELIAENLGSDRDRFLSGLAVTLVSALDSKQGQPAELESSWLHQGSLVLKFRGIDTRSDAETLKGMFVCIPEEQRRPLPEGQIYLDDLIGCEVDHNRWSQTDWIGNRVAGSGRPGVAGSGCGSPDSVRARYLPGGGCGREKNRSGVAGRAGRPESEMIFHVLTIFPDFFEGPFAHGVVARAREAGVVEIRVHNLRDWTSDRHKTVDDRPFGGGEGMLLKPEPIFQAVEIHLAGAAAGTKDCNALGAGTPVRSECRPRVEPAEGVAPDLRPI